MSAIRGMTLKSAVTRFRITSTRVMRRRALKIRNARMIWADAKAHESRMIMKIKYSAIYEQDGDIKTIDFWAHETGSSVYFNLYLAVKASRDKIAVRSIRQYKFDEYTVADLSRPDCKVTA